MKIWIRWLSQKIYLPSPFFLWLSIELTRLDHKNQQRFCEKISRGRHFVVPCAVQGFHVMPLEQVQNEGILFLPLFQSEIFLRSLGSAKLLWLPSDSSHWRGASPHLTSPALTAAPSAPDCRFLRCSLASHLFGSIFLLTVDSMQKTSFYVKLISVNLS